MRMQHNPYGRRRITKSVKWFKHWVSHDVVGTGGQCRILKWVNEASLKAIEEKNEQEVHKSEPEATTEVLFLCNYEGCGITFIDAGALRKHSQMHGERQYICQYEGCGKVMNVMWSMCLSGCSAGIDLCNLRNALMN
ncbi:hypothetical protein Leryth_004239 [Lithospermum erythrorhizon]|nr:hypothetical protein Leryth_004239 [Lithospermum erythrorhizon]